MTGHIVVETDDHIATVRLNRPEKLNAMTKPMWRDLGAAMRGLSAEDGVRCVVVRGTGGKAFSPGNDISEFETERSNKEQARAYGEILHDGLRQIRDCRHPTVALIEGICVGGGLEIAGSCDIRICGASARFGAPIKRLGLVMAYPEIGALMHLVGRANAAEILLEGEVFDAERAREMGIVSRIVPDDRVVEEAYETAQRVADGAPLVARAQEIHGPSG